MTTMRPELAPLPEPPDWVAVSVQQPDGTWRMIYTGEAKVIRVRGKNGLMPPVVRRRCVDI